MTMARRPAAHDMEELARHLAGWIESSIEGGGGVGAIVGVSGGVDSAVVAALCKRAFLHHSMALVMPCASEPADTDDAHLVAHHFGIASCTIDLTPTFHVLTRELHVSCSELPADDRSTTANVKPRLRMTALYALANHLNYRVVGTGNASELAVGYYTKHGDGAVDLLPLGNVAKTTVVELARHLEVPARIVDKPPSAGLWAGQTDEDELGFTYAELDAYLAGKRGPHAAEIERRIAAATSARARRSPRRSPRRPRRGRAAATRPAWHDAPPFRYTHKLRSERRSHA
jgi:NAD+ synthase